MGLFNNNMWMNVRRNHGLEHATINVLSQQQPNTPMVGRSDWRGFSLYGNLETEDVVAASQQALARLRDGESDLAIHPRCGTVLVTTGLLTGLAAFAAISLGGRPHKRFRWGTIPEAILAATFASVFAQPAGMFMQANYTVSGEPENLEIESVTRHENGSRVKHRVVTRQ